MERQLARRRAAGSLTRDEQGHGPRPKKRQRLRAWLPGRLEVAADATLDEHAAAFVDQTGVVVSLATMPRAIASLPLADPGSALTPAGRRRRPGRSLEQRA